MHGKTRLIMAILMSGVMAFMVTLIVTILNVDIHSGFLGRWMKAYFIAWPIAAVTSYVAMPLVRRVTDRIVAAIDVAR